MITNEQFEAVYNEFKSLVYNLALNYVQHQDDAQDITQEVFVKIYQHYHTHNPAAASLKTWIYRVTVNHCLDFIRSKKSKKRFGFISSLFHNETNEPVAEAAYFDHPGVAAEDKEALGQLFTFINELPENQKTALILTKIEDRTQKEVAEIMNTTVKAVESLLQRAKQTLAKKMKDSEGLDIN
jgi:RNA polymerase sigma factor (sigma-70 family)